jgi:lysophospholipase L1-like esterase
MAAITAANLEIARLDDGQMVRFLDINTRFLAHDGTIPHLVMPDQLHPNAAGYQLWTEAIQAPLAELMKQAGAAYFRSGPKSSSSISNTRVE